MATASQLLPIDESSVFGDRLMSAQRFQLAVAEALLVHHTNVQAEERANLEAKGDAHLASGLGAGPHADAAYADVAKAAQGTPWADHVRKPEVEKVMREILDSHFQTSQRIERDWHKVRAANKGA